MQFEFLGAIMGMSIRSGVLFYMNIASVFWKALTSEQLLIDDLEAIDHSAVQNIKSYKEEWKGKKPEKDFIEQINLFMVCKLSSGNGKGQEIDLIPNGSTIQVTYANLDEYCKLYIEARLSEFEQQLKWIKRGIDYTFRESFLIFYSWQELEHKIIGESLFDIEHFKSITDYRECDENHETIKLFWKVLESFENSDRE